LYWPRKNTCLLANKKNIYVGINAAIGRPGTYIQGKAEVYFGNYVQLAPNVGVLSSNHDLYDQRKSFDEKVVIGDYSWVGMNSVILPGVKLGTRTIVAAGSVVTKSFPEGYCVIAGSPAKIIRHLDKEKFVPWHDDEEFYGFIPKDIFEKKHSAFVKKLRDELDTLITANTRSHK
jgi:acetyltransferase-like isoleucine patch superfamily enzyme